MNDFIFTQETGGAMLIKEYRISLPMSVEEYRIAQLYMIQVRYEKEAELTALDNFFFFLFFPQKTNRAGYCHYLRLEIVL